MTRVSELCGELELQNKTLNQIKSSIWRFPLIRRVYALKASVILVQSHPALFVCSWVDLLSSPRLPRAFSWELWREPADLPLSMLSPPAGKSDLPSK